jgi:acyl-coenzyme A synthetase/AMP-(fatty) acid ligase
MSTLDLFLSLSAGASLVIVPDEVGRHPEETLALMERERITIWYSAPKILTLIAQSRAIERYDLSRLRVIAFAGEVFPIEGLKSLVAQLPRPEYFNFFGSTETNVMMQYAVPKQELPSFQTPVPLGVLCEHFAARVVDERGEDVPDGEHGELVLRGPAIMLGYWRRPDLSGERQLPDAQGGPPWYRTRDVVKRRSDGVYLHAGRLDRMVKRGGFRVELGDVEAALHAIPEVKEAAITSSVVEDTVSLTAHLVLRSEALSILQLKSLCAQRVPSYMVPDRFQFLKELPRTSTNKIDYQSLLRQAGTPRPTRT